ALEFLLHVFGGALVGIIVHQNIHLPHFTVLDSTLSFAVGGLAVAVWRARRMREEPRAVWDSRLAARRRWELRPGELPPGRPQPGGVDSAPIPIERDVRDLRVDEPLR
ncbi:MAG: hypothetical protein U0163_17045, partial [Gemmatimonadaceae bacterium]